MDETGIYVIYYKDKTYIGQTTVSFKKRWNQHKYCKEDDYFHRSLCKYGWENFKFEILYTVPRYEPEQDWREELNSLEEMSIDELGCLAPAGFNSKKGGENRYCHPLTREKLRIANLGEKNPHYGKFGKDSASWGRAVSEAQRQAAREFNSKKTEQWSKDGKTFIKVWNSAQDAEIALSGRRTGNIHRVCKGKRKTAFKFLWKYQEVI